MEKLTADETRTPDPIPGLAADLAAVLAKMLAKRPEDRFQTADDVVAALDAVADSSRAGERPRRPWRRVGRPRAAGGVGRPGQPAQPLWDREHDAHLAARVMACVRPDFVDATWEACARQVRDARPAREVASENAALVAKSRVLRRLREEQAGAVG